jgi:hypothetical protein
VLEEVTVVFLVFPGRATRGNEHQRELQEVPRGSFSASLNVAFKDMTGITVESSIFMSHTTLDSDLDNR